MNLKCIIFDAVRKLPASLPTLGALSLSMCMMSCESIYDNQDNCDYGISLGFVYDYHMEPGANAFPENVDCVDVLVFDTDHNLLARYYETSEELRDENYTMDLPLNPGNYHIVVYGGLACENPAFDFTPDWNEATSRAAHKNDILVSVPLDENGVSNNKLHDIDSRTGGLFYGTLDLQVSNEDRGIASFRKEIVHMMKNTNNIQIILQELTNPYQVNYDDYNYYITDNNFVLDGYNNPVSDTSRAANQPKYHPYSGENRIMGLVTNTSGAVEEDESTPVQVGCVEFSTSRLMTMNTNEARLVITSKNKTDVYGNEKEIINIPLITYLTAIRGYGDNWIKSDQEFLDRQSRWNMMFFLQKDVWISTRIAVNNWIVRVYDIEM